MDFNMVAMGQSTGLVSSFKGLTAALPKAKMDREKKYMTNLPEWHEGLKSAFVTYGFTHFLREEYGRQVPYDQVVPLMIDEEARQRLAQIKQSLIAKAKEEKLLKEVTLQPVKKEEKASEAGDSDSEESAMPVPLSARDALIVHWPEIEGLVFENAKQAIASYEGVRAAATERGEHFDALFVDPLTRVTRVQKYLNPQAVVTIDKSDPHFYQVEAQEMRVRRMTAFGALKSTLTDMPKRVWKHIAIGNVHALYSLILETYAGKGRSALVENLQQRLSDLKKHKNETFVQFVARFEQLILEIKDAGMQVDETHIATSLENAILRSDDQMIKDVFEQWVMKTGGRISDPFTTLSEMRASMLVKEKMSKEQDLKHKKRQRGKETQSEGEVEQTLKTVSGKNREEKGSHSPSSGDRNLLRTCADFQSREGCKKDDCPFEHRKLSAKDAAKLKTQIEARRAEKERKLKSTKCFQCGETGHFKYACPEGQDEKATTNLARARDRGRSRERSREREPGPYSAAELEKAAEILEFQRQQRQQEKKEREKSG